jgi:iron-sulfur cluster assembly protein
MITLTDRALKEIKRAREEQGLPQDAVVRIGIRGGGCAGFSYFMGFEAQARENDVELPMDGIKVVVDPKSLLYLKGTTIDFNEDMLNRGFVFQNPNAKSSCGCGHSFTV